MKNLISTLAIPIYAFIGFMMMMPFIISFIKEELVKKIRTQKIRIGK